jgi:restriction endonuclease S subunit
VSYIGLEHIESNTGALVGELETDISTIKSLKNKFKAGDVLYGKLRPNLNKVWLAQFDGICSTDILVLRAKSGFNAELYANLLRDQDFNKAVLNGIKGAQLPRIGFDYLSQVPLPLIPSEEQDKLQREVAEEARHIESAKRMIELYEEKVKSKIAEVWGE